MKNRMNWSSVLLALCVSLAFWSCGNESIDKLKREVETINEDCPISLGSMGDLINMKYEEDQNNVVVNTVINGELLSISDLKKTKDLIRENMGLLLKDDELSDLMKAVIEAEASLEFVYRDPKADDSFELKLSAEDLREIDQAPEMDEDERNELLLKNQVEQENSRCPYTVAEGMEMVEVELNGSLLVYHCEVDESMYNISYFREAYSDVKSGIVEYLRQSLTSDEAASYQIVLLRNLGIGICYRYIGNMTGEYVDVEVSPSDLRNL